MGDLHDIPARRCQYRTPLLPRWLGSSKVTSFTKGLERRRSAFDNVDVTIGVSVANGVAGTIEDVASLIRKRSPRLCVGRHEGVGYDVGDMRYSISGDRNQKPVNGLCAR